MRAKIVLIYMPKSGEDAVTVSVESDGGQSFEFNDYTIETAKKFTVGAEVELVIALTGAQS